MDAVLALGISAIMAQNAAVEATRVRDINTMVMTGQYMQGLQVGVNRYISASIDNLAQGLAVSGVANPYAPTIQELVAGNWMPAGWTTNNPANLNWTITITPSNCPGPTCQMPTTIQSSAYRDSQGRVRNDLLGYAVSAAGLDAGQSLAFNPGQFTAYRRTWTMPNGTGSSGALMMRAGSYTNGYVDTLPFYKLDGSRKLTGTMQANGQNITGAGNIGSASVNTGAVTANSVALPAGNSLTIAGTQWYGDSSNAAVRTNGALYIQTLNGGAPGTINTGNANVSGTMSATQMNASNSNIWGSQTVYGNHTVNGALVANNVVYLPALAWEGYGCSGNGITTDPTGKILSCQSGVWRQPGGGGPHGPVIGFQWGQYYPGGPCGGFIANYADGTQQTVMTSAGCSYN
ncbi:hypothetical protein CJ026_000230 [Ralstonia pickettii]|uniref:hypothetical protein n=1 Tax=Ralstonia pickettii TaxID=329 RepID=UPI000BD93540|nr:hypothetical protein [Ralstonia pickettii]MBT2180855.1 hypothetical protein [Ralstonia pickettii]POH90113.1 hypothetical protein CJ026_000230 [Ralstonia pickettii]